MSLYSHRCGISVRCADIQAGSNLNVISTPVSNTLVAMNHKNMQSELNFQTYGRVNLFD